jgi:competence protein ComEA
MKQWQQIFLGIVIGLLLAAGILLITSNPRENGLVLQPAPTPLPWVVHIAGAVTHPGVYEVPRDSRVIDAINAAGGFTNDAESDALNLADHIQDGSRLYVPEKGEYSANGEKSSLITPPNSAGPQTLIDINSAALEELMELPDIGEKLAGEIITYRSQNGKFATIDDIKNVPGIGQGTFEKIRTLITVE